MSASHDADLASELRRRSEEVRSGQVTPYSNKEFWQKLDNWLVKQSEVQQTYEQETQQSLQRFLDTDLHVRLDEVESWAAQLSDNPNQPFPPCHK